MHAWTNEDVEDEKEWKSFYKACVFFMESVRKLFDVNAQELFTYKAIVILRISK